MCYLRMRRWTIVLNDAHVNQMEWNTDAFSGPSEIISESTLEPNLVYINDKTGTEILTHLPPGTEFHRDTNVAAIPPQNFKTSKLIAQRIYARLSHTKPTYFH